MAPQRPPHASRPHAVAPSPLVPLGPGGRPPDRSVVGAKAASLGWLASHGVPVPAAVAVPADVAGRVAAGDTLSTELLAGALRRWLDPSRVYAVRSSAEGEDGDLRSFAGQLESRLDVPADGCPGRPSARSRRRTAIGSRPMPPAAALPMPQRVAVVIQEMVPTASAGVAFSRNPLTGLDEVVVEAVPARGDALAGDGVTPDRWVRRWGAFTESPAEPRSRALVEAVARETRPARACVRATRRSRVGPRRHTRRGGCRPARSPGIDGLRVYSNRIARDVLPGVIKPLVWSVNVPLVNAAWIDVLEELVGPLDVRPEDLARSFGYRAYFDMTTHRRRLRGARDAARQPGAPPRPAQGPRGARVPARCRGPAAPAARCRRRAAHPPAGPLGARRDRRAGPGPRPSSRPRTRRTSTTRRCSRRIDAVTALARRAAYANIVVPLVMHGYDRVLATPAPGRAASTRWAVDPAAGTA